MAVVGFGACSSVLLVINKVAIHNLPAPGFILFLQCSLTALSIKAAGAQGMITVDPILDPRLLRAFFPVGIGFLACLYCNSKTLQFLNVETFIVCRNSTPVLISVLDWAFLGRELPGKRSMLCILCMVIGAVGYALTDSSFVMHGYVWLLGWVVAFVIDQVFIKYVVDSVSVASNWSRAMLTNFWASVFLVGMVLANAEEWKVFTSVEVWTPRCIVMVALSCFVAVFISYFGFLARKQLSATSFTVVGNACKVISVLINVFIWDKHASPIGLGMLAITLTGAILYQAAPLRDEVARKGAASTPAAATSESEKSALLAGGPKATNFADSDNDSV
eukprot:CAMPEP_0179997992 /NCGR_PEP_ID=MMETSP0984-20121128/8438_1 /TAXON_ID=483367 /ORGANISM="non described non described, Strain CCMP 2436" /LENGTH=332 /DNA_ID=CAMNT_0021917635 /DNA_START=52 /DNA_END=1050 /DNA_ORIENTATION=+